MIEGYHAMYHVYIYIRVWNTRINDATEARNQSSNFDSF